ncbi:MAG: hypothetical protein K9M45_05885 [Kiritimatiellales bacterium]|nr:hypothetical protein [Kiritimatiellales bacterium]
MRAMVKERPAGGERFPLALAMVEAAVADSVAALHMCWRESLEAERAGDISLALEIHKQILSEVGKTYVVNLRAGWLYYQTGGYSKALECYEKAARSFPEAVAPLLGAMCCQLAMGKPYSAARLVKEIIDIDGLNDAAPMQLASLCSVDGTSSLLPFPRRGSDRCPAQQHGAA